MTKSTIEEIRERFDHDMERFSNLDTGQRSTVDATISVEIVTEESKRLVPHDQNLLYLGCGAGNYTLMMLSKIPKMDCTLVDLSSHMLERGLERVSQQRPKKITGIQEDNKEIKLSEHHFDIILASTVLHHLRDDNDWETIFKKLFRSLKPGGCLMIADLITQEITTLNDYIWEKYRNYLESTGGKEYCQKVLDYVTKKDYPRSMSYQLNLMKKVGFIKTEILNKNMCFGVFGSIK